MTFLARGDVALSVAITSVTTLLAPIVTPALIYLLASQWIEVSAAAMFWSIVQVVILPIVLGVLAQYLLREKVKVCVDALPLVSVAAIVAIVAAVVAGNQARIATSGLMIFAVVVLHNGLGLLIGYLLGRACGLGVAKRKTLSIEVGMQNSGLGWRWPPRTSRRWPPCPARSSASGTTFPARWPRRCCAASRTTRRTRRRRPRRPRPRADPAGLPARAPSWGPPHIQATRRAAGAASRIVSVSL
nr:bile acid:sodium symporter family protein [Bordetella pertussis]